MLISFPETLHVLDAGHPDCFDWRRLTMSIEQQTEFAYIKFKLRRKAGGRHAGEISSCHQFRAELDRITEDFYRAIDKDFAGREDPHHPLIHLARCRGFIDMDNSSPRLSFRIDADCLPNFLEMSNHTLLEARNRFSEVAQRTESRRRNAVRL